MAEQTQKAYAEFLGLTREIHYLSLVAGVLEWDQQTMMPPRGAGQRAAQMAALTGIVHDRVTHPRLVELIAALETSEAELDLDARVNLREMRRACDRACRIPRALAQEIASTQSLSQEHWVEARQKSDFAHFAPWLEKIVTLRRQEADALGYEASRYDPLLDEYEPTATTAQVDAVFRALRPQLTAIAQAVAASGIEPKRELLTRTFPVERQKEFALWVIRKLGFDFTAGRVDASAHPMTNGSTTDVRLTTRYDEHYLPGALFGLVHEAGHGMYGQGLDERHMATPRANPVSLGIHESQSRLWENFVARSHAFWEYAFPYMQVFFPQRMEDITLDDWYAAVNDVRPSLIRVEADEVTYSLHIILRFEIERDLIEERIRIRDLPALWNAKMKEYLGVIPANDGEGVLQDIHWSLGLIGYFPTYALGNLYAAQFYHAAQREIPDLERRFATGDFLTLKRWLNAKIHAPGQTYRAAELVAVVTGEPLNARYLIEHLKTKFGPLYGGWA